MEPEARRAVAQRGVGAGKDAHPRTMHRAHQREPLLEHRASHDVRVRWNAVRHREDRRHIAPERVGDVARKRIARHLTFRPHRDLVLRHERRRHPRAVPAEALEERPKVRRRARPEHPLHREARRERQRLGARARRRDGEEMLETPLSRVGCVRRAHRPRHVPGEREPFLPRRPRRCEVRLTRQPSVDLHEIHTERGERVHRRARFHGSAGEQVRDRLIVAVEVGTRRDDPRPDEAPARDLAAPRRERRPVAGHVAHARDAVRHVQREHLSPAGDVGVHVQVPEARHEELPAPVHDARSSGHARGRR